MLAAINGAKQSVEIELYRFDPGQLWRMFSESLVSAAERSVCVRLIADSFGSRRMSEAQWSPIRSAGIAVRLTPSIDDSRLPWVDAT
jgi:phosphatidylserine/phosphatidylglycerophosphate/cardiolipin synthase-like enzyme